MERKDDIELLKMTWASCSDKQYTARSGEIITINRRGEYDDLTDRFRGAEIKTGESSYYGDIIICADDYPPAGSLDSVILHVSPAESTGFIKSDDTYVPQAIINPDPVYRAVYETLKKGCADRGCSRFIARQDSHQRIALFTRLLLDRLKRKSDEIKVIYEENQQNWNETMYITIMRAMGSPNNKQTYTELAGKVEYSMLSREKNTPQYVESLLLGASGLLDLYEDDSYIRTLKSNFNYLRGKYNITPMKPMQWESGRNYPIGNHVLRLAQMASFIATHDFLFNKIIRCRTVEDLHDVFRAEASDYWSTHYIPASQSSRITKRIGPEKANVLGINAAVPLIFTFGDYMKEEQFKYDALDLLEKINCESNYIINMWKRGGLIIESAFDSQAVIQLNNEYCAKELCWKCPVGKRILKENYQE